MFKSSVTITYKIDEVKYGKLKRSFQSIGLKSKESGKGGGELNYNQILKDNSTVEKYKIDSNSTINKNVKINSIFLSRFFDNSFPLYYISFSFNIDNIDISIEKDLKSLANEWVTIFRDYKNDEGVILRQSFKDCFKIDGDFKQGNQFLNITKAVLHVRYIKEVLEDNIGNIKTLLKSNGKQNLEDMFAYKNEEYALYINNKSNIALEYCESKVENSIENVNIFLLANSYKDFYMNKNSEISKKSQLLKEDDYLNLLDYATSISKHEAMYYFKNPTNTFDYEYYYKSLKIEELHNEFVESLDRLINFIGLLHDKKEAKTETKKNFWFSFVGLIIGSAALISTGLDIYNQIQK